MEESKYKHYIIAQKQEVLDNEKLEQLKQRLAPFAEVENIDDAKKLADSILPTRQEYTSFYVGNAKYSIINKHDMFRISIDTASEFICYDFS